MVTARPNGFISLPAAVGWFFDHTGGLVTLSVCSATQATALTGFLMTQDEIGLFNVSAFFGLGFSGLVPAYVLTLREFFPVRDARWRVPTLLLFSGSGMAAGAWMGGALYDLFYGPSFFHAIAANVFNFIIVVIRIPDLRSRSPANLLRLQTAAPLFEVNWPAVLPKQISVFSGIWGRNFFQLARRARSPMNTGGVISIPT
jgi:hypothetical protein